MKARHHPIYRRDESALLLAERLEGYAIIAGSHPMWATIEDDDFAATAAPGDIDIFLRDPADWTLVVDVCRAVARAGLHDPFGCVHEEETDWSLRISHNFDLTYSINIIKPTVRCFAAPGELLASFDVTPAQAAYDRNTEGVMSVLLSEAARVARDSRTLMVGPITPVAALHTLHRLMKYQKKGYHVFPYQVTEMAQLWATLPADERAALIYALPEGRS